MKYIFALVFFSMIVASCNHFDTTELDTQFAYFKSANFKSNNKSGFNNGGISDLHVLVDGKNTGILRLPQSMPFIPNGEASDLIILPAVAMNGIKSNSLVYPPCKIINKTLQKNINNIDTLDILIEYKEEVKFDILAGFEISNSFKYNLDDDSITVLKRSNETAYEGNYSGKIHLTKSSPIIQVASTNSIHVSGVKKGIFLELTYKGDIELFVGLSAKNTAGELVKNYKLFLAPRTDWTTVHIDLTKEILGSGSEDTRLLFGAELDKQKLDKGDIFIDNVKLLYL